MATRGRGGPRESRTFDREADAKAFAADIRLRARLGHLAGIDSGKVALDSYVSETWVPVYAAQLAENTRRTYRGLYVSHIAPFVGDCALRDLTPQGDSASSARSAPRGAPPIGALREFCANRSPYFARYRPWPKTHVHSIGIGTTSTTSDPWYWLSES